MAEVGHPVRGDLPELGVEHLERDVAVVADPAEVVEDRPELEVSLAGQDAVAVAASSRGVPLRSQTCTQARFAGER